MIDALEKAAGEQKTPFGEYEEEAIVSLLIEHPEFFKNIAPYLETRLFKRIEVQYIVENIIQYHKEYNIFPSRGMLRDRIAKQLTVDDIHTEDILKLVDKESDPRDIPAIKDRLLIWAKHRAYDLLWSAETIERFNRGDYQYVEEIFEKARRIQEVGKNAIWFFKELEKFFEESEDDHFTTGFSLLDAYLHDGGPCRSEMIVWMAPTGVGKSILLSNNAIANLKKKRRVLYITLELSDKLSGIRAIGALTDRAVNTRERRNANKAAIIPAIKAIEADGSGELVIYELPPDEVSVDAIYNIIDDLKKDRGWIPDVIIIDYLELLISRRSSDNDDSYTRQKAVATQIRGLAKNTNTVIFTATQTNRAGNEAEVIDVTKLSESYGKAMPMDYLLSINQTEGEYTEARNTGVGQARIFIAKNRNGPKFESINIKINYETFAVRQNVQ